MGSTSESKLEKKVYEMSEGDHACLIYDSLPQQMAAVLPFVKAGIERNEACLYIAHDRPLNEVKQIFSGYGIAVEREVERGSLIFSENNMPSGNFDPKEMVAVLRDLTQNAIKKGFKGFRGVGEMTWVLGNECGCDRLIEYEGLLNETFPTNLTGMCQYNRTRFKPEVIRDILRTHPVVVVGDAVCRNLYCESHHAVQGTMPKDHGVGWMLDNLVKFHDLEQKLRYLIQVRDDFVTVASHELRTPVTALKMQNEINARKLLNGHVFAPEEINSFLQTSGKQIKRLELLIESILDVSLVSKGKITLSPKKMDLVETVEVCVSDFRINVPAIKISYDHPKKLIGKWDPVRIQQAVTNLLSNAVKYGENRPIQVIVSGDAKAAHVSIIDQGMGIPKENQSRIFELYERGISYNNISGLGLGLYIVDQIVKAHGGSILLKSKVGQGSTFTLDLPNCS